MAVVDPECRALISEASQTSSAPHADPAERRQGAAQPASEACVNRQLTNTAAKAASQLAITLPLGAPIASTCKA
jgi:hypothetical protein